MPVSRLPQFPLHVFIRYVRLVVQNCHSSFAVIQSLSDHLSCHFRSRHFNLPCSNPSPFLSPVPHPLHRIYTPLCQFVASVIVADFTSACCFFSKKPLLYYIYNTLYYIRILLKARKVAPVETGGTYGRPWKPLSALGSFISLPNINQRNA